MYIVLIYNKKGDLIKEEAFTDYYWAYSFLQQNGGSSRGEIVEGWY